MPRWRARPTPPGSPITASGLCRSPAAPAAPPRRAAPTDRHVGLLVLAFVPSASSTSLMSRARKIRTASSDMPGRGEDVEQHVPALGLEVRLLVELALRRPRRASPPRLVEQPGRRLPEQAPRPGGGTAGAAAPARCVVQRDDADRAGVHDDVAGRRWRRPGIATTSVRTSITRPDGTLRASTSDRELLRRLGRRPRSWSTLDGQAVSRVRVSGTGPADRRRAGPTAAELGLARLRADQRPPRTRVNSGCGAGRARLELRVRLGADEERVHLARQLDELDQPAVRRGAGEDQAGLLERSR